MSIGSASGGWSKHSESASSARWSPGSSGPKVNGKYSPPARPQVCGEAIEGRLAARARSSSISCVLIVGRRPDVFGDPAARPLVVPARGAHAVHQIGAIGRIVLDAGVDVLQPAVPPAQRLLQEADAPARARRNAGICGSTGPTMPLTGASMPATRRGTALRIAVVPAADRKDRRLRSPNSPRRPSRASSRRRAAGACSQSGDRNGSFSSRFSHMSRQRVADDRRVRRPRRIGQHGRAPAEILVQQAAAHVVDVVGIAVVGRAERDDRLQRRRLHAPRPAAR